MKDLTNPPFNSSLSADQKMEKKICNLLKRTTDPKKIFTEIKTKANVHQISRFLYNSGLNKTLLEFSSRQLEKGKPVSWPYVLKVFIKYKITLNSKMEKFLFHNWLKNKKYQSPALFACKEWEDVSPEFQQLRMVYLQNLEEKNISEENKLLEQLDFVQAQNLIKEEEEIIAKLIFMNPQTKKYKEMEKELKEKKALLTIQENKKQSRSVDYLKKYSRSLSEKKSIKESWHKGIQKVAKESPNQTKNLAFFLYFCNWGRMALNIWEKDIKDMSDYWFYLEWTLETKQYTKGLELVNYFLSKSKEGAIFLLPLIYIKSQILHALGKESLAIEYLTAISQVQPNYKNTQYLLDKWLKNI